MVHSYLKTDHAFIRDDNFWFAFIVDHLTGYRYRFTLQLCTQSFGLPFERYGQQLIRVCSTQVNKDHAANITTTEYLTADGQGFTDVVFHLFQLDNRDS